MNLKIEVGDSIRIQKPSKDGYKNSCRIFKVTGIYLGDMNKKIVMD